LEHEQACPHVQVPEVAQVQVEEPVVLQSQPILCFYFGSDTLLLLSNQYISQIKYIIILF
jgi:hypothetical protein